MMSFKIFAASLLLCSITAVSQPHSVTTHYDKTLVKKTDSTSPCPPWQVRDHTNKSCTCVSQDINRIVSCKENPYQLLVLECFCMTYTNKILVGPCPHSIRAGHVHLYFNLTVNSTSNLNSLMCVKYKRKGQMCGSCEPGYSPPVYSYDLSCVNCTTNNWVKYIAVSLAPLTGFYLFVIIFSISATSPTFHGYIIFNQFLACSTNMRVLQVPLKRFDSTQKYLIYFFTSLSGMWNLDFFRLFYTPFCLHPNTSTLQVLSLDYITAVYPLLLIGLAYLLVLLYDHNVRLIVCLWKPFVPIFIKFRRQWNIKNSLVDAFATFFLLSYVKILSVSMDLLMPVVLYDKYGHSLPHLYVFNQGDVAFLGSHHLPYACLATFFLITFTLLPMFLLFLYPCSCFQRCLNHTGYSCHSLHIFMDTFQGHYKNGTNGTRDYRFFSGLYLLLRAAVYASTVLAYQIFSYAYTTFILVCITVLVALCHPYRRFSHTITDVLYLSVLAMLYVTLFGLTFSHIRITERGLLPLSLLLVLLSYIGIILYNILKSVGVYKLLKNIYNYYCQKLGKSTVSRDGYERLSSVSA